MDFLLLAVALALGLLAIWMGFSYFKESKNTKKTFHR